MPVNSVIASHEAAFWFGLFVADRGLAELFPARIARGVIHTAVGIIAVLYGVGWLPEHVSVDGWIPSIPSIPPTGKQILDMALLFVLGFAVLFLLREFREVIRTREKGEMNGDFRKIIVNDFIVGVTLFFGMWGGFLVALYLRSVR